MPSDPVPAWVLTRRRAIGDRVRATRTGRALSQEKLGELAGLDRKTVNRIEQGTHATLIDHLLLLADALGVPLAELVREPPSADGSRTGPGPASPRRET